MDQKKPWIEAFQVSPQEFQSWNTLKSADSSVTFWALENGHLTPKLYYDWARNFYGLSVLNEKYFEHPKDREFWDTIRSVANWSQEMLPLEQWDGVIFVGCVEPLLDVNWSFPVAYILCSPQDLRRRWQDYQAVELSFTDVPPIPVEKAMDDGPVGLTLSNVNFPKLNLEGPVTPPAPPVATNAPVPPPPTIAAPSTPKMESVPETHEVFFQDDIPTGVFQDPTLTLAETDAPATAAATTSVMPREMVVDPNKAPANAEEAQNLDQALTWFCKNALVQYQHVFFLMYEGNVLKPYRVSNRLTATGPEALKPVDPSKASVFRIVKRTNLPYHGPVVDSEINKAFFSSWGFENYPPIVTCLPLMFGSEARGQILAVGDEKCAPQEILQLLERLTTKLFPTLAKVAA